MGTNNFFKTKTRKKKTDYQRQVDRLDNLWGLIIRKRENDRCEKCGCPADQPHHFIGRRNRSVRWDLDNGFCLCRGCHTMRLDSAHQDPSLFDFWAINKRGKEWYKALRIRATLSWKCQDLTLIEMFLKKELKELENKIDMCYTDDVLQW